MKIYDESLYCAECGTEISVIEDKFLAHLCEDCTEDDKDDYSLIEEAGNDEIYSGFNQQYNQQF